MFLPRKSNVMRCRFGFNAMQNKIWEELFPFATPPMIVVDTSSWNFWNEVPLPVWVLYTIGLRNKSACLLNSRHTLYAQETYAKSTYLRFLPTIIYPVPKSISCTVDCWLKNNENFSLNRVPLCHLCCVLKNKRNEWMKLQTHTTVTTMQASSIHTFF